MYIPAHTHIHTHKFIYMYTYTQVHWDFETLQVGLFSAQCSLYGNATVDFDYLRDSGAHNFQRTFGEAAGSGVISEEGLPSGGWGGLGGVGGQGGPLRGADLNASGANFTSVAMKDVLKNAMAAALGDEAVKVFEVADGAFTTGGVTGGLYGGDAEHIVLRGTLTNAEMAGSWNNVSSAHFITSKRYQESFGDVTDGMMWNGTAWVPSATIFNISIRPNLKNTQYVFFVDGVERPLLTLSRPSSFRNPNIYVFRLDPHSFSADATYSNLPAVNQTLITRLATQAEQDAERARQGAGLSSPHAFVISTVDMPGLTMQYTVGTRNNGATSGQIELRVWPGAPDVLYYESSLSAYMGGQIRVEEALLGHAKLIRSRRLLEVHTEAEWGRSVRRGRGHADMEAEAQITPRESFRVRLQAYYSTHNVDKLAHLDDMVEAWNSKEEQLNGMLIAKYGVGLRPEGHEEDVWEEGEEDPQEIEGKRRAFAARGTLDVETGAQGWMGGGAHSPMGGRPTPPPRSSPPTPAPISPPSSTAQLGLDAGFLGSTLPPTLADGTTTPRPEFAAESHELTGSPVDADSSGGSVEELTQNIDHVNEETRLRRRRRKNEGGGLRAHGGGEEDAEAEEARWRKRDRTYLQQQREGTVRMDRDTERSSHRHDTDHIARLHTARAAPLAGEGEITALPGGVADAGPVLYSYTYVYMYKYIHMCESTYV